MQIAIRKKAMPAGRQGFTLIELLVVIAVIGMIASIVLVSLGPARKKARDARRQADIKQINLAMEMCYDDSACTGPEQHPDSAAGANNIDKIDTDSNPLYLDTPVDPLNSCPQCYYWTNGTNQHYCVYVKLEAENVYFCASNKGVAKGTSATPTNTNCCGYDVTN